MLGTNPAWRDEAKGWPTLFDRSRISKHFLRWAVALAVASTSFGAAKAREYSSYELRTLNLALDRVSGEREPHPKGKQIEQVQVVQLDVVDADDQAPKLLNWFHATTRPYIVERELLLSQGDEFSQRLSDETERNLRSLGLFTVVVAVALRGSTEDTVRYLVVTKDLWSVRAGWDFRYANGVLDYLSATPSEINLLGTGRQLWGTVSGTPRNWTLGLGYTEPRLDGSRLRISASGTATINCQSGSVEGYSGSFSYAWPQYSTRTPWAFSTSLSVGGGVSRLLGAVQRPICGADNSPEVRLSLDPDLAFDDPAQRHVIVPNEYHFDSQSFSQTFTRSFGYRFKTDLSFGVEALRTGRVAASVESIRAAPSAPEGLSSEELARGRRWYLERVRPTTARISPFLQVTSYFNRWQRTIHLETLGLQEDFRMGPVARLRIYPADERLGSSRSLLGAQALASYAQAWGSGYLEVQGSHNVELAKHDETFASASAAFRVVTPRLPAGRFLLDAVYSNTYRNFYRSFLVLDNRTRLRGYRDVDTQLTGTGQVVANVEFRSHPVDILSTLVGAVVFYDVGDAFYENEDIHLRHGLGAGIRFLIPQLDREVFRLDVGFPADPKDPLGEITVNASFGQAFSPP